MGLTTLLAMGALQAGDEARHRPDDGVPRWEESWDFDFTTEGGELGGYLHLGLRPRLGLSRLWAVLVGDGRPLVSVVDHHLPLPRGPGLDLRGEGLWVDPVCETPLEHWSLGLEAFGVALDDPTEAYRTARGDRTALGFDLEWETSRPAVPVARAGSYHLPCLVHGDVLVGPEVIAIEGWGGRGHAWGSGARWDQAWCTITGRLDDGVTWQGDFPEAMPVLTDDGLPRPFRLALADPGLDVSVTPRHHAPVLVDNGAGRTSRLVRSLCRLETDDGRIGAGWSEWNQPQPARSLSRWP